MYWDCDIAGHNYLLGLADLLKGNLHPEGVTLTWNRRSDDVRPNSSVSSVMAKRGLRAKSLTPGFDASTVYEVIHEQRGSRLATPKDTLTPPSLPLSRGGENVEESQGIQRLLEDKEISAAFQDFFVGLSVYNKEIDGRKLALRMQDGDRAVTPIFTTDTRVGDDGTFSLSILLYGKEIYHIANLSEAQRLWRIEDGKRQSKSREEHSLKFLLSKRLLETIQSLPADTSYNPYAYTEIPLDKISLELTNDEEFESLLRVFELWVRFRPMQNLYFSGTDCGDTALARDAGLRSVPARLKMIQDFLARLQSTQHQGIVTTQKPTNALLVKLNFIDKNQITLPILDTTKGELVVHVASFQDGDLPDIPRALAIAEGVQAIYSPFFHVGANDHSPLLELTEANLTDILERIQATSIIRTLNTNPQTWHEVFTGSSQARLIRQVMVPPILQFLNERLKALQLLQQVLSFA